jgi:alginate O-acetyltransferase complex protein AlgI
MIVSILINYFFALGISRTNSKLLLAVSITVSVLILGFFKYANFLMGIINSVFGTSISATDLPLPIGISFYTFQILSYIIDIYTGKLSVQKNIIKLGTYISLFPQLIAGPIVRYEAIEQQLSDRHETFVDFSAGYKRFILGLGKKVLVANQMALIADEIYALPVSDSGARLLWIASIAYTFQIYFDFSGYSDMAIGLGRMFGFRIPENFNYPYIATSITDFWLRWHMSLSSWFRDYIYIPLGGNRVDRPRWFLNLFIVWVLNGLWHGAAWNFVLWGLYYAVLLVLEKLFLGTFLKKLPKFFGWSYTMFIVVIAWVLFRVEGLDNVLATIKAMFSSDSIDTVAFLVDHLDIVVALPFLILAVIGSTPIIGEFIKKYDGHNFIISVIINLFLMGIFYMVIATLISSTYNPFIYFRF